MTKLRRMVEKLEKPEDGYSLAAIVCYDDDEEQWYVFSLSVKGSSLVGRSLLYAIPGVGRMTPFVTKRQTPKGYRTLETLIRQINDIFGDRSRLSVLFNLERHVDLKDRFLYPEDEES